MIYYKHCTNLSKYSISDHFSSFQECHVDEHCKPKFTCSVNFTNFDEDKEVDGECIDPCLSFTSNCNNETETCIAKNHRPQCVGNYQLNRESLLETIHKGSIILFQFANNM